MENIICPLQTLFRFPTEVRQFGLIGCSTPGPKVRQVPVFKPSGLQDPEAKRCLILSPARQEREAEEEEEEEVRGDSEPHSQDNGRSVGLAKTLRSLRHV